ncbi:MbcA/ParS/Xre antitoxin family protein [Acetobacteraceae bacterium KSS8]|uniref:MbcA/ParS/Xre antitoxin family protein n=1 Tax=Endosaccharibacter trunci TaxID=2812733 RepID=A0ABT1W763_9PROT|nr:MbcA/ParS/Xre antitoxin family protein [Acetobacteraceae bacterium KSS8]
MRANFTLKSVETAATPGSTLLNLSDPAIRLRLTPAAIEGMIRLAALWRLNTEEICLLLGDMSERSWFRLKKGETGSPERPFILSQDMLTRISVLIGVFKGLRLLFSEKLADEWIKLPNRGPLFGGRPPLEIAIERGIPGLLDIRAHVDALRGGL